MKATHILLLISTLCISVSSFASVKKYKYKQPKYRSHYDANTYDPILFYGFRVDNPKPGPVAGTEIMTAFSVAKKLYLGFNVAGCDGKSYNNYGYNLPDIRDYHISVYNAGCNVNYMFFRKQRSFIGLHFIADFEEVNLWKHPYDMSWWDLSDYTLSTNDLWSFRPGMSIAIGKNNDLTFLGSYNFVAKDNLFGQAQCAFGQISEFEGPQLALYYNPFDSKGHHHYGHYHHW